MWRVGKLYAASAWLTQDTLVCVCVCLCVRHFVYLHNKQSESQNKIIDARIFGAGKR